MLNTISSLMALLKGTLLDGQAAIQLEIPESSHRAFAIAVPLGQDLAAWSLMRSHLTVTHRYPVLVLPWVSSPGGWEQQVLENDFFSRFFYQEEPFQSTPPLTAPEAIAACASQVNLDDFLRQPPTLGDSTLDLEIEYALAATQQQFGCSPPLSDVKALVQSGVITSPMALERWLFEWELQTADFQRAIAPPDISYLDWYSPHCPTVLMLLPTVNGWESLAYLHWYGASNVGSAIAIGFLQRWYERYHAELVCHYGTMLQFQVGRPPTIPRTAFELAWEQYALAPCTLQLPGIALRDHARSVRSLHHWFLHERP